jgi:hypothetical protein
MNIQMEQPAATEDKAPQTKKQEKISILPFVTGKIHSNGFEFMYILFMSWLCQLKFNVKQLADWTASDGFKKYCDKWGIKHIKLSEKSAEILLITLLKLEKIGATTADKNFRDVFLQNCPSKHNREGREDFNNAVRFFNDIITSEISKEEFQVCFDIQSKQLKELLPEQMKAYLGQVSENVPATQTIDITEEVKAVQEPKSVPQKEKTSKSKVQPSATLEINLSKLAGLTATFKPEELLEAFAGMTAEIKGDFDQIKTFHGLLD